ncbi:MAG: hypothetical protein MK135_15025, partial [Polyangiaceae bacterium]|nr:hypothetical protein [Polyangiaceae bacterium]
MYKNRLGILLVTLTMSGAGLLSVGCSSEEEDTERAAQSWALCLSQTASGTETYCNRDSTTDCSRALANNPTINELFFIEAFESQDDCNASAAALTSTSTPGTEPGSNPEDELTCVDG